MKVSRIFLVAALSAVITLGATFGAILVLSPADDAHATSKLPEVPFKFEKVYESSSLIVSIDWSTRTSFLDKDEDLMSAAVFQVIRKQAKPGEQAVFVNVFTSLCGFPGVLTVAGKAYTVDGVEVPYTPVASVIDATNPSTAAGATYTMLCADPPRPTPIEPSYKAPDRYTKFWS